MHYPHTETEVQHYIDTQVRKAFESIQREFKRRHLEVEIREIENGLQLHVDHHHEINFTYKVVSHATVPPSFMLGQMKMRPITFKQKCSCERVVKTMM
jgi:choline/glycine/proline betaine transport protein